MTDPIKARIIELIPEIMKQDAGCRSKMLPTEKGSTYMAKFGAKQIYTLNPEEQHWDCQRGWVDGTEMYKLSLDGDAEILGHSIQLHDVLRAIEVRSKEEPEKMPMFVNLGTSGAFYKFQYDPSNGDGILIRDDNNINWNLLESYDHQEQPVKDLIGTLLGVTNPT